MVKIIFVKIGKIRRFLEKLFIKKVLLKKNLIQARALPLPRRDPVRVALALVLEKTLSPFVVRISGRKRFSTFGGYPSPFTRPDGGYLLGLPTRAPKATPPFGAMAIGGATQSPPRTPRIGTPSAG